MIDEYPIPFGNRKHYYQIVRDDIVQHYSDNKVVFKATWDSIDSSASYWEEGTACFDLETIEFLEVVPVVVPKNVTTDYCQIQCGKKKKIHCVSQSVYDDLRNLFRQMNEQKIISESNKIRVSSPILSLEV